jgi:hypothetical protein
MTATNKQYSYSRVTVIQIDVHPTGETQSIRHMLFTLDSRMIPDHTSLVIRVANLLLVPIRMKHVPKPRRSLGEQTLSSSWVTSFFLPHDSLEVEREVFAKCLHIYISLLDP